LIGNPPNLQVLESAASVVRELNVFEALMCFFTMATNYNESFAYSTVAISAQFQYRPRDTPHYLPYDTLDFTSETPK